MKKWLCVFLFAGMAFPVCSQTGFTHRGYLGWLIDLSWHEHPEKPWPSVAIDSLLLRDYHETLDFIQSSGMNEITLWGLFSNKYWEPDVETTISAERKAIVQGILAEARRRHIKVLCGMGVYSWGFDKILQQYPAVRCACNPDVMDLNRPEAWEWQKKIIDYVMDNFGFDGMSLQSADKGICQCDTTAHLTDMEYHARLNQQTVRYIKSRNKPYLTAISGWGMDFSKKDDLPALTEMTQNVDYLIDVGETALRSGTAYRVQLIKAILPCSYGSTGTPNIEPIQAMPRNAYFVPTALHTARSLQALYQAGGRASETYVRTRGNPGDKITIEVAARLLSHPERKAEAVLAEVVEKIFQPKDAKTLEKLTEVFVGAENAYFENASGDKSVILLMPRESRTFTPAYLQQMKPAALQAYYQTMKKNKLLAASLTAGIRNQAEIKALSDCLNHVITDIEKILSSRTPAEKK